MIHQLALQVVALSCCWSDWSYSTLLHLIPRVTYLMNETLSDNKQDDKMRWIRLIQLSSDWSHHMFAMLLSKYLEEEDLVGKGGAYCFPEVNPVSGFKVSALTLWPAQMQLKLLRESVSMISCTVCSLWSCTLVFHDSGHTTVAMFPHKHTHTHTCTHIIINTSRCSSLLTYAGSGWYAEPDIPPSCRLTAHVWCCSSEEPSQAAEWRTKQTLTCSAGWCFYFLRGQSVFHSCPMTFFCQHMSPKVLKVKVFMRNGLFQTIHLFKLVSKMKNEIKLGVTSLYILYEISFDYKMFISKGTVGCLKWKYVYKYTQSWFFSFLCDCVCVCVCVCVFVYSKGRLS